MPRPTKTTLYLDAGDYSELKQIARRKGAKTAAVVREAVAEYARRHRRKRPYPSSIGSFRSGIPDLAERYEEYMDGFGADSLGDEK